MKTKKLALFAFGALAIASLVGCGNKAAAENLNWKKGDTIYTETLMFDRTTKNPVHFKLGINNKNVKTVKIGRSEIKFGYRNGILTLSAASLKKASAGEWDAVVSFKEGGSTSFPIFNADKFIKTPQDFQDINNNLDGYYVLANDIDFSQVANFEPLGRMADETDPENHYFHGILEGNGHALRNMKVSYSDGPIAPSGSNYPSNYDIYSGNPNKKTHFTIDSHVMGDNIGVFQCIGSSGVVRNVIFDNVDVHGRTIVGVIAGNIMGMVKNCLITSTCSVLMDTHFWDDDCNCGGAFGIVAGQGKVSNVVNLSTDVKVRDTFEDYGDQYIGESGAGYDHGYNASNPYWRFWGNDKVDSPTDSNGSPTNGTYAFVGKCWGMVENSVTKAFRFTPNEGAERNAFFGQTHLAANKPTSGDSNLGSLDNCQILADEALKSVATYETFSAVYWNITDGSYPTLQSNIIPSEIAQ